jgi:hypothetical protein
MNGLVQMLPQLLLEAEYPLLDSEFTSSPYTVVYSMHKERLLSR